MVSRQQWVEFSVRHSEKHPGGVIDRLFSDWQRAKAQADQLPVDRPPPPPAGHTRGFPGRIARMLAERLRRGR